MASRLVALETPAPALSASSSATSWEVVASDDDDGVAVKEPPGGEEDRPPLGEPDTGEPHAETVPSASSGSSAGSAGASAAMRRLRDLMVAEGTREEERRDKKKRRERKKRFTARARLERARVRASARRYRDLGLCERECAALAIATELVFSEFRVSPTDGSLSSCARTGSLVGSSSGEPSADAAARAEEAESARSATRRVTNEGRFRLWNASARVLLRSATRFAAFAAFARLGKRLRDAASFSDAFRADSVNADGFRERPRRALACAVVAAAALAAAARVVGKRSAWPAAAAAAAAATKSAAAAGPARVTF